MNFPENLKYTKDHEWIRVDGDAAYIGITDFAQKELGEIVYVDIPTVGETLKGEEAIGSIEAVKTVSDLFTPIEIEVLEVNEELEDAPELVNTDPYGKGWIVKVRVACESDLDALLSSEEYKALIKQ